MKKFIWTLIVLGALLITPSPALAQCVSIQSGQVVYPPDHYFEGQSITTGFNAYGYNYQAHSFRGSYFNAYAGSDGLPPWDGDDVAYLAENPSAAVHWAWDYRTTTLAMKWNDAWLSNKDCGGDRLDGGPPDGLLDILFGFASYVGSGASLTNHTSWDVTLPSGKDSRASEFIKIIALPEGATIAGPENEFFGEDTAYLGNKVIGPQLWGEFAVIQYVLNDKSRGYNGLQLKSQLASGFGFYKKL